MPSLQRSKFTIRSKASDHGFASGFEPWFWLSLDSYFLNNDAVPWSLWFTLRWWSHYVPCFFFCKALVSTFGKILYKSLKCLARKIGRHLEKKQHHVWPSKMYFYFMSILFPKAYNTSSSQPWAFLEHKYLNNIWVIFHNLEKEVYVSISSLYFKGLQCGVELSHALNQ